MYFRLVFVVGTADIVARNIPCTFVAINYVVVAAKFVVVAVVVAAAKFVVVVVAKFVVVAVVVLTTGV